MGNEAALARIDPRVVQIRAEHVAAADRLFKEVAIGLPSGNNVDERVLKKGAFAMQGGAVSVDGEMFHDPFMFTHARVGQELYKLKTQATTVEAALNIISNIEDQENIAWGVGVDPNATLDKYDGTSAVSHTVVGLWRREVHIPEVVKRKLGVIGGENV